MRVCGSGLSCEEVCRAQTPGRECRMSLLEFADLFDAGLGVTPELGEVLVPVSVM